MHPCGTPTNIIVSMYFKTYIYKVHKMFKNGVKYNPRRITRYYNQYLYYNVGQNYLYDQFSR